MLAPEESSVAICCANGEDSAPAVDVYNESVNAS